MSCPDGQSVLVLFSCLEDLVSFMYAVYDSMLIDVSEQFYMLPVALKLRLTKLTSTEFASPFMTHGVCKILAMKRLKNLINQQSQTVNKK